MGNSGLERLKVWVQAKDLAVFIYKRVVPCLPMEEKWGLISQVKRSAVSIPANIAEGYGRYYYQSNVQFCYNARGSLQETISHVILAVDLGYLTDEVYAGFITKANELLLLLNGYIAYLKKTKIGSNELTHKINENQVMYDIEDPVMEDSEN